MDPCLVTSFSAGGVKVNTRTHDSYALVEGEWLRVVLSRVKEGETGVIHLKELKRRGFVGEMKVVAKDSGASFMVTLDANASQGRKGREQIPDFSKWESAAPELALLSSNGVSPQKWSAALVSAAEKGAAAEALQLLWDGTALVEEEVLSANVEAANSALAAVGFEGSFVEAVVWRDAGLGLDEALRMGAAGVTYGDFALYAAIDGITVDQIIEMRNAEVNSDDLYRYGKCPGTTAQMMIQLKRAGVSGVSFEKYVEYGVEFDDVLRLGAAGVHGHGYAHYKLASDLTVDQVIVLHRSGVDSASFETFVAAGVSFDDALRLGAGGVAGDDFVLYRKSAGVTVEQMTELKRAGVSGAAFEKFVAAGVGFDDSLRLGAAGLSGDVVKDLVSYNPGMPTDHMIALAAAGVSGYTARTFFQHGVSVENSLRLGLAKVDGDEFKYYVEEKGMSPEYMLELKSAGSDSFADARFSAIGVSSEDATRLREADVTGLLFDRYSDIPGMTVDMMIECKQAAASTDELKWFSKNGFSTDDAVRLAVAKVARFDIEEYERVPGMTVATMAELSSLGVSGHAARTFYRYGVSLADSFRLGAVGINEGSKLRGYENCLPDMTVDKMVQLASAGVDSMSASQFHSGGVSFEDSLRLGVAGISGYEFQMFRIDGIADVDEMIDIVSKRVKPAG